VNLLRKTEAAIDEHRKASVSVAAVAVLALVVAAIAFVVAVFRG